MSIRDWPIEERPREKFLLQGPQSLSEAELLCLRLNTGSRGKTVVDLARELLSRFGGLRPLLSASLQETIKIPGLGKAKFVRLQAARELGARYLQETMITRECLESPGDARDFLIVRLRDLPYEVFACVFLDNRHRVIKYETMFRGTINGASVHPREVVKRTLELNAAALIVAHNHPSGVAEPSDADIAITGRLREALKLVDVRLLDHLIVGDPLCVSLNERGLM